ncbi:MAG: CDP-4-dehydro-6-deoxy-D-glucose 3-dehydratase [Parcubacteria group bacterium Gr01-1014_30]|nr:MAG: CDP-4-dehydro-6-deoxy-D-glucose 3-dehydratase [Parcubacteria group bacterium Gr01-1014_30]
MELVELYSNLEKYFRESDHKERHPAKFRVPIGGSFYDEKEVKAVLECYLNGWLSTQIKVVEFEKIFSDYIGARHAVAVNSGTSANILALNALMEAGDLKKGDEVIVPATTFVTVVSPVVQLGMVPVYVDVEKNSLNIDPKEVERAINREKTKAIMVVHTLGRPAQMDKIMEIAKKYNLKVIEDCCEAHGAAFKDKKVGTFGDLATFSFYVAHNITTGEGGTLLTNSDKYHQIAAELREFGRFKSYQGERFGYSDEKLKDYDERYVFHRIGYNFRMADAPAAFGIEQVKKLDMLNEKRIQNAKFYTDNFDDELKKVFQFPSLDDSDFFQVFYAFPIVIKSDAQISRTKAVRYLESKGIETRALFCSSLPDQPCFKNAPGRTAGLLPVSRFLRDNAFFIGCHPGINENDLSYVIETLKKSI